MSQGGLSKPDAKWLYQSLKGVGGWDRKKEWQRMASLDTRSVNVDGGDAYLIASGPPVLKYGKHEARAPVFSRTGLRRSSIHDHYHIIHKVDVSEHPHICPSLQESPLLEHPVPLSGASSIARACALSCSSVRFITISSSRLIPQASVASRRPSRRRNLCTIP